MAHIHTEPGQHDLTCSIYIVNIEDPENPKALLHRHRKLNVLMQPGGHIELNEHPWQSVKHELLEETGYELHQLITLQPHQVLRDLAMVEHPVPLAFTTGEFFTVPGHFHTNLSYAFVTEQQPLHPVAEGESDTLRWVTAQEIEALREDSFPGVLDIYLQLLTGWQKWNLLPATAFAI